MSDRDALYVRLRACWVRRDNLRVSAEGDADPWAVPAYRALVLESIRVQEWKHRVLAHQKRERELFDSGRWLDWLPDSERGWGLYNTAPGVVFIAAQTVEFRRGFAHTLRGPLAAFWGEREGRCGTCNGVPDQQRFMRATDWFRGKSGPSTISTICPVCNGSGAGRISGPTPAFAALVGREPVERADPTDEGLAWFNGTHWVAGSGGGSNTFLPTPAWELFMDAGPHPTEAAAKTALSDALIRAGRAANESK